MAIDNSPPQAGAIAAAFNPTADNTTKNKYQPPRMQDHTPQEFELAEKVLHQLANNSNFFPQRAGCADWFHSRDVLDGDIEPEKLASRRLTTDILETDDSVGTFSLSSDSDRSGSHGSVVASAARRAIDVDASIPPLILKSSKAQYPSIEDESFDLPLVSTFGEATQGQDATDDIEVSKVISSSNDPLSLSVDYYSPVPSIHEKDINYGAVLGDGSFCEVRLASLKLDGANKGKNQQRYAMKYLSPTQMDFFKDTHPTSAKASSEPKEIKWFDRAIADLALEARFLTLLSHEHIIKLHYVSEGMLEEQFNCEGENHNYRHQFGYFFMLDLLFEDLDDRIQVTYVKEVLDVGPCSTAGAAQVGDLKSRSNSKSSWWKKMMPNKATQSPEDNFTLDTWKEQLANRLTDLKDIALALQYMHDDCNVVYRDIKPDNIGFYRRPHATCSCGKRSSSKQDCSCYDEIPKLFDFGLAKELKPVYLKAHLRHNPADTDCKTYKLTSRLGSPRYMAPEVAFSTPYNEKADVYGFGIMLYQVASLVTPFDGFSLYRHQEDVLIKGHRPNVKIPSPQKAVKHSRKENATYKQWSAQTNYEAKIKHVELLTKCVWSKELKQLIEECWDSDMRLRPSMKNVVERLDGCISKLM